MQKFQKSFPVFIFPPTKFNNNHYLVNIQLPVDLCEFSYHIFGDKNFQEQGKTTIIQNDDIPIVQSFCVKSPQTLFIQWYSKDEDEEFFFYQFVYLNDFIINNAVCNDSEINEESDSEDVSIISIDNIYLQRDLKSLPIESINKNIFIKIQKKDITDEEKEKNKEFFKTCIKSDENDVMKINELVDNILSSCNKQLEENSQQMNDNSQNTRQITNIDDFRKQFGFEETPIDNTPIDNTLIDNSSIDNSPIDNSPIDNSPIDDSPITNKETSETILDE